MTLESETPGIVQQEQLVVEECFIRERLQAGVSVIAEVVGPNRVARVLAPTISLQEFARQAGPLAGDQEPQDGEDN